MFNNIYRQKIKRQKIALKSRKARIKELEDKVSMLEFFYDGNGFTKRGLNTAIQIANYIDLLEKCMIYLNDVKCDTYITENTGLKIHNACVEHKLSKAKELLKQFLNAKSIEEKCVAESEAEKFLKDSEVKE